MNGIKTWIARHPHAVFGKEPFKMLLAVVF